MKYILTTLGVVIFFLSISPYAEAHVVVKPNQVGVGAFQTFTVGVPNERDNATVGVRLVIPEGLAFVSPNVKPGWNIEVKKNGTGENANVTEIIWSKGSIPAGQRDDFNFSAQVPTNPTIIQWKTYQTYADGTIIAWDQKPADKETDDDSGTNGPYSETKIIDDLSKPELVNNSGIPSNRTAIMISVAALVVSMIALAVPFYKK